MAKHSIPNIKPFLWSMRRAALIGLCLISAAAAQTSSADSLSLRGNLDAELLFRIKWSLLQRQLYRTDPDSNRITALPADVRQLLEEALEYAQMNDYDQAIPYLDVVLNYLPELDDRQPQRDAAVRKADLTAQLFCGSDLWQQQFGISISDQDSTIFEDEGNAFIGIRMSLTSHQGMLKDSRMFLEAKYSREYLYGYFDFSRRSSNTGRFSTFFENRLEGVRYAREKELRYWHNRTRALAACKLGGVTLAFEDELQLQQYAHDSSFFSSFRQNQAALVLNGDLLLPGRTDLRYDFRLRRYPSRVAQNYSEHLLTLSLYPNYLHKTQFTSYTQLRRREYDRGFIDSLLTNPYSELYHETKMRMSLCRHLNLQCGVSANFRQYRFDAPAMPHYRDLTAEAKIEALLSAFAGIKIGYRHRGKRHYFTSQTAQATAEIENLNAYAPIVEADIFYGRFMLSVSNVYEIRRYPASPDGALSLYADRDVNTLFLLLSWALTSRWEINAMANIDNDMARNPYSIDSRSNIINFELLYKL